MNKRMRKLQTFVKNDLPKPVIYGSETADLTIVSWGSNKGSINQAISEFSNVNYLHVTWMNPFPVEEIASVLKNAKKLVILECNYSGQLAMLIRQHTGIDINDKILKFDGRPFFVEEVIDIINERLKK
jgi:2-oxoglutarate ferredoxin oxidoreductase subunit alpha